MSILASSHRHELENQTDRESIVSHDRETHESRTFRPSSENSITFSVDADYQHHLIHRVSPIQSVTYDKRISVSVRPAALDLASILLQREAGTKLDEQSDHERQYQLGDLVDTSNLAEWALYLSSEAEWDWISHLMGFPEDSKNWTEENWTDYFQSEENFDWSHFIDHIEEHLSEAGLRVAMGPEGNHDGAAWGNGVQQTRNLFLLGLDFLQNTSAKNISEKKIKHLLKRVDSLQEVQNKKQTIKRQEKIESFLRMIDVLERRISYIDKKLEVLCSDKEITNLRNHEIRFLKKGIRIPRFLIRVFFGLKGSQSLSDHESYWSLNAGESRNTLDKGDYLYRYLNLRYPHLSLINPRVDRVEELHSESHHNHNHDNLLINEIGEHHHKGLQPLSIHLNYFQGTNSGVHYQIDRFDLRPGRLAPSEVRRTPDKILRDRPGEMNQYYNDFWQEPLRGEFVSLIDLPHHREAYSQKHYVFVQAKRVGDLNGKAVYELFMDGLDGSEVKIDLAYFGYISKFQRQILQMFMDEMKSRHHGEVLFFHASHYPLKDYLREYWVEAGWQDYFAQDDVLNFSLNGHGHTREIFDETKPTFLGTRFALGRRSVKQEEPFYSVMTPSVTDSPNETAHYELSYNNETKKYELKVNYDSVISDDDLNAMDQGVIEKVESFRSFYSHNAYHQYALLPTDSLNGLTNIFLSQDAIQAFDAIPLSVGQFYETLLYARAALEFLQSDFDEDNDYLKMFERTVTGLESYYDLWMNGDPEAEDEYDRMGYRKAFEKAEGTFKRRDRIAMMIHFDDIYNHPLYQRLRFLIGQTPQESRAYDFWLLLGKRAADEEYPHAYEHGVEDEVVLSV